MLAAAFSGILVHAGHCYQILVFTVPHFRDPGAYGTPLSGSWWFRAPPPGSWWFRAPPSGILVLAAAFSGIQVGLRPLFRHPGVYGTPLSGSRWVCGPSFGILVVSAPPLRDPSVFAPRPSGSWWGILWRHSVSCGARACGAFKSHAVSPGCRLITAG